MDLIRTASRFVSQRVAPAIASRLGRFRAPIAAALGATALCAPAAAQYQIVWQDEFNGSSLDLSKWEPMIGTGCPNICGWGNNEQQFYRAQNATVGGGTLKITARRENFGGAQYTSARLRTKFKGDWTYGRFEMRAKMPVGQGMWPAFWMLPTDSVHGVWAASGEIDIMEYLGSEPSTIHGTTHFGGTFPANTFSGNSYTLPSGNFHDTFHEFAIEWEEEEIRWYVDGILYRIQNSWFTPGAAFPAPFNERFHLLLNLAVGGNWPGPPDGSTQFPQTFEVDWVRVLQEAPQDPNGCDFTFDDMEHADPLNNNYFTFEGSGVVGALGASTSDAPPIVGGNASLDAAWTSSGAGGYMGGFGRPNPLDLTNATHFEMWIRPDAGQAYDIEINLQDDDNGDGVIPSQPDGADDEFQAVVSVGPPGSDVVAGAGWQKVRIALADFVDDGTFHFGGNGVFDPTPTTAGGNGQLVNVVLTLANSASSLVSFRTDEWRFLRPASGVQGRIWSDENRDGVPFGDPGIEGVVVELVDQSNGQVVAADVTSALGEYGFDGLVAGQFNVRVDPSTLPVGATAISDPDGPQTPNTFALTLECDDARSSDDFGYNPLFLGQPLCSPAELNSTGAAGQLLASGSVFAAENNLTLLATSLPPGQFGFIVTSRTPGTVPNPGGSQGTLCVIGDIGRYNRPGQLLNSGPFGQADLSLDLGQTPQASGLVAIQPGETWYFQFWHRDVNPSATSNFTAGLGVSFQ